MEVLFSHLTVVVLGSSALLAVAHLHAPRALTHHMAEMEAVIGQVPGMGMNLQQSYLAAVGEALLPAGLAGAGAAIAASGFVAWGSSGLIDPRQRLQPPSRGCLER